MARQQPPGWYADPQFGEGKERWWDGSRYSGPTRPARSHLVSASVRPAAPRQRAIAAGLDWVVALPAVVGAVAALDQGWGYALVGAFLSLVLYLLNSLRGGAVGATAGKTLTGLATVEERSGSPLGPAKGVTMGVISLTLGIATFGAYPVASAVRSLSASSKGGPSQGLTEHRFGAIVIAKKGD